MAVRMTTSTNSRSNYKPSTPSRSSASSSRTSVTKAPTKPAAQSKPTAPAPRRDTFTYSSPKPTAAAKTTSAPKTVASKPSSAPKTAAAPKTTAANKPAAATKPTTSTKPTAATKPSTTSKATTATKSTTASKPTATKSTSTTKTNTSTAAKTTNAAKTITATNSNKLNSNDYNKMAAQVTGVQLNKNGVPLFTSYDQQAKYNKALLNLHSSDINKSSTPQQIAAASAGIQTAKKGMPNNKQMQDYSTALNNIRKSNSYTNPHISTTVANSKSNVRANEPSQGFFTYNDGEIYHKKYSEGDYEGIFTHNSEIKTVNIEAPSNTLGLLLEDKADKNKLVKGGNYDTNQHTNLYIGGSGSAANYNGKSQVGVGNKTGLFGEASCSVGNANMEAGLDLNLDKSSVNIGASVGANAIKGSVGVGFQIKGYGFSLGLQGSALGVSAEAQCGVKNGRLSLKVGATSGLLGGGFYFNIGKIS